VILFILKKIGYNFLVLLGAITFAFILFNFKPGNAARGIAGNNASEDIIETIEKKHNLDLPLWQQYALYINDVLPFSLHNADNSDSRIYLDDEKYNYTELVSFGSGRTLVFKWPYLRTSYQNGKPVNEIISDALPGTVVLAVVAMAFATFLGIILGILAAIWKGSFFDNGSLVLAVLGMSAPSYFMAIIVAWIGGYLWYEVTYIPLLPFIVLGIGLLIGTALNKRLNKDPFGNFSTDFLFRTAFKFGSFGMIFWIIGYSLNAVLPDAPIPLIDSFINLPGTGLNNTGSLYETDDLANEFLALDNLILPAITLGIRPLAIILQLTRSSMLDVLSQDYMRTARAKGLSNYRVVIRHGLKNALNPVVTAVSGWFASLLAGAVFIEVIFSWKGLGLEMYNGIIKDDYPVILGCVIVVATTFVFINVLVDIVYGIIDPRIRLK
jgi:ABC-type dipeptide/oligopeptide/nickel transport system permease component